MHVRIYSLISVEFHNYQFRINMLSFSMLAQMRPSAIVEIAVD